MKIYYVLQNFQNWKTDTKSSLNVTINEDTGEIKQVIRINKKTGLSYTAIEYKGKFETYQLTVNEISHTGMPTKYFLIIEGSLHKNHFNGENYSRFTFTDLLNQINHLCLNLHLKGNQCKLRTFEYGLNLPVNFIPIQYLGNNLICYQRKQFDRFKTEKEISIGYDCRLSEYKIKLYDKGLQHNLEYSLMRFEKAYKKMTSPKKIGIKTLADLTKLDYLKELQKELLQAWYEVLLFDNTVLENESLPDKDKIFLLQCRDPNYWKTFSNTSTRKYNKDKFKSLLLKYGNNKNVHDEVKELLTKEFKNCTLLPSVKKEFESQKLYTFTVKVNSKNVQNLKTGVSVR